MPPTPTNTPVPNGSFKFRGCQTGTHTLKLVTSSLPRKELATFRVTVDANTPTPINTLTYTPTPTDTPTPTPSGSLSAPAQVVQFGTTSVTASNLAPSGTWFKIAYPNKLREGTVCGGSGGTGESDTTRFTRTFIKTHSFDFIGCNLGLHTLKLLKSTDTKDAKPLATTTINVVTPTPTPTPTPVPCTISWGRLNTPTLGSPVLKYDGNERWTGNCKDSSGRPVKYYEFELDIAPNTDDIHITVDLITTTGGAALQLIRDKPHKILLRTEKGYPGSTTDARIAGELRMGRSTPVGGAKVRFKIAALMETREPTSNDTFGLSVTMEHLFPHLGHQADYTVQYRLGTMPPTPTPVAIGITPDSAKAANGGSNPTPTPTPTPVPFVPPDPGVEIPMSIDVAAAAWNQAVGTSWPNVQLCETTPTARTVPRVPLTPTPAATAVPTPISCETSRHSAHDDGKRVHIEVRDGYGGLLSTRWVRVEDPAIAHSGHASACVKPRPVPTLWNLLPRKLFEWLGITDSHMGDLDVVIEDPAWVYFPGGLLEWGRHVRVVWTTDRAVALADFSRTRTQRNKTPSGDELRINYLPATMMHEFGHAAGLEDLYNWPGTYPQFLMDKYRPHGSVPPQDIVYLKQVYRNEHGSEPHEK